MKMTQEKAYDICLEILEQREYNIIDKDKDELRIIALKSDGNQIIVLFNAAPKFDIKSLKETITMMNEIDVRHAIVVHREGVTSQTRSTLDQSKELYIELFLEEDLQYNITKHRLQPKFEKLDDSSAEDFKKKYGMKFGTLRLDKPISRFYDYQRGDVIRITRNDGYINFRIVKG
jgi:DNA-directed RNA polymerase subunit H (RpoH/RPB5)